MSSDRGGPTRIVIGSAIILIGLLLLLGRLVDVDLRTLWPFFIIVPGAVVLMSGLAAAPGGAGTAATVTGSQLTGVGLLLFFQNLTGLWQTWAYAWALIWPTTIGLALVARGSLSGDDRMVRTGTGNVVIGLVLFVVGFAFFEGILNISGASLGVIGDLALPIALIGAGLLVIFRRR